MIPLLFYLRMRRFLDFLTIAALLLSFSSLAAEVSEEERLKGFAEHNRRKAQFEKERLTGVDDVKKKRQEWEKERQKAVGPYKIWKSKQGTAPDESSPEYKQDLAAKKKHKQEYEKSREQYARQKKIQKDRQRTHILLTEEQEYGLNQPDEKVDPVKRNYEGGKASSSGSRGRPTGNGSADFNSPPPPPMMDYSSPPPPPEFYEPEMPPPPPPPMDGSFEDPIPPPVFDEPDNM